MWRAALVALANSHHAKLLAASADGDAAPSLSGPRLAPDPLLLHLLRCMAARGFLRDASAASDLRGSLGLVVEVAAAGIANRASFGSSMAVPDTADAAAGSGAGGGGAEQPVASSSASAAQDISAALRNEVSAMTTLHMAGAAVAAMGSEVPRGPDGQPHLLGDGAEARPLRCALALGRFRQEVGYEALAAAGAPRSDFGGVLGAAPAPESVLSSLPLSDDENAAPLAARFPDLMPAVLAIRAVALRAFGHGAFHFSADVESVGGFAAAHDPNGLLAELFPDERIGAAARAAAADYTGALASAKEHATAVADNGSETVAATDLTSLSRRFALCAAPVSAADAAAVVVSLRALAPHLLKPEDAAVMLFILGGIDARIGDAAAAAADADEAREELVAESARLKTALEAAAFCGRILSQPDVVALLVHLIFHPSSALDGVSAEPPPGGADGGGGTADEPAAVVADTLAWVALHAGRAVVAANGVDSSDGGGPRTMEPLAREELGVEYAGLNVTDSGVALPLLSGHQTAAVRAAATAVTVDAASAADSGDIPEAVVAKQYSEGLSDVLKAWCKVRWTVEGVLYLQCIVGCPAGEICVTAWPSALLHRMGRTCAA